MNPNKLYIFLDENKHLKWHFEYETTLVETKGSRPINDKLKEWTIPNPRSSPKTPNYDNSFGTLENEHDLPDPQFNSEKNQFQSFKNQKNINDFFKKESIDAHPTFLSDKSFQSKKITNQNTTIYIQNGLLKIGSNHIDKIEQHYDTFPRSVWYSNLQKLTRNTKIESCCKVAKYLIEKDLNHFCRRYSIIMMEDANMKREIIILIGLMMFTNRNQVKLSPILMKNLLYIVASVSSSDFRDNCYDHLMDDHGLETMIEKSPYDSDYFVCPFAWCLWVRSEYGGMKGDQKMMRIFSWIWYERLNVCDYAAFWKSLLNIEIRKESIDLVETILSQDQNARITKSDIMICCMDQHCGDEWMKCFTEDYEFIFYNYQYFCQLFNFDPENQETKKELIKKLVWFCKSSFSNKSLMFRQLDLRSKTEPLSLWYQLVKHVIAKHQIRKMSEFLIQ